jgi:hypothetical protein
VAQTLSIWSPSKLLPPEVVVDPGLGGGDVAEVHSEEAGTTSLNAASVSPAPRVNSY